MEKVDDSARIAASPDSFVTIEHSIPFGRGGQNLRIRVPIANCRNSEEIDPYAPIDGSNYSVKPCLWAPLITPIKYPGLPEYVQGYLHQAMSPWLPQALRRKQYAMQKSYYAICSERSDNPGYYGGMALAALALEAIHGVSPNSIKYARKLIEGFLAMEMNGRNGYIIRYLKWHTSRWKVKEIRGASSEELLGIMLGIMYYLKAESQDHPLYAEARDLRDRILWRVSQGALYDNYSHPFMTTSYWVKHFELAMDAAKGNERGSETSYITTLDNFVLHEKRYEDMGMILYSIILVLEGGLPDNKKEEWAGTFLRFVKRAVCYLGVGAIKNAYLGVVALLINKYLNAQRDCALKSRFFLDFWTQAQSGPGPFLPGLDVDVWDKMISSTLKRIAQCRSVDNERFVVDANFLKDADDQWQHNLPLITVVTGGKSVDWTVPGFSGRIWIPHNPHKRIGSHFPWKGKYPHWWRRGQGAFTDFATGNWKGPRLNELEYNQTEDKRYSGEGYLVKEVLGFRGHEDTQVEASGMDLLFLRMLLTQIDCTKYPPPKLPDRDACYPVLPFPGVEPLEPKFLHHELQYSSTDFDWKIGGDKNKSLGIIFFPSKGVVVTASADENKRLCLNSWRLTSNGFQHLFSWKAQRFDQVILKKTSAANNPDNKDILVVAERAEEQRGALRNHFLRVSMFQVWGNGVLSLLVSQRMSDKDPNAVKTLDMCIMDYQYACVTFKTRHDVAAVKILTLDFANNKIIEGASFDAEYGTEEERTEIDNSVWIGCTANRVLINGYLCKHDPHRHFELFSRRLNDLAGAYPFSAPAVRDLPMSAVTVRRGNRHFLVTASYYSVTRSGAQLPMFELHSWEIMANGQAHYRGDFTELNTDLDKYLFKSGGLEFERLSMSRTLLGEEGNFVLAGKSFTDARRSIVNSNQGLIILYGGVLDDGRPTLWDWNCIGSGSSNDVKMVDICGDACIDSIRGVITASKDEKDSLFLNWWRFSEDFHIGDNYQINPPGLATWGGTIAARDGND